MPVVSEMHIKASEVKRGDRVFDKFTGVDSTFDYEAFDIKRGHKYVTIKNGNSQVISRREFDETVMIERMVPTEEEIAAKKAQREAEAREFFADDVEKWVNSILSGWENFAQSATAEFITRPDYSTPIETLMIEAANVRIARRIEQIRLNYAEDWADAFDKWAESARKTLIAGVSMGSSALSRSTSVISNLTEDVYMAALRQILEQAKFGYLR